MLNQIASILKVDINQVEKYFNVWGEFYNFETSTPEELALMIKDIVYLNIY